MWGRGTVVWVLFVVSAYRYCASFCPKSVLHHVCLPFLTPRPRGDCYNAFALQFLLFDFYLSEWLGVQRPRLHVL